MCEKLNRHNFVNIGWSQCLRHVDAQAEMLPECEPQHDFEKSKIKSLNFTGNMCHFWQADAEIVENKAPGEQAAAPGSRRSTKAPSDGSRLSREICVTFVRL